MHFEGRYILYIMELTPEKLLSPLPRLEIELWGKWVEIISHKSDFSFEISLSLRAGHF